MFSVLRYGKHCFSRLFDTLIRGCKSFSDATYVFCSASPCESQNKLENEFLDVSLQVQDALIVSLTYMKFMLSKHARNTLSQNKLENAFLDVSLQVQDALTVSLANSAASILAYFACHLNKATESK